MTESFTICDQLQLYFLSQYERAKNSQASKQGFIFRVTHSHSKSI